MYTQYCFIILFNFRIFIIIIDLYISFSKCILIRNTLILICKTFVDVVL